MKTIKQLKEENHGFITAETINDLIEIDPKHTVLIRCGGCRLIVMARDVDHVIKTVEKSNYDYVRDVSFLAGVVTNHVTH